MTDFDKSLPHEIPWNYPWIKDEIERRDEYIAQLEAELAHQKPQDGAHGAIDGESVKVHAEDESGSHSEPDSREKLEADMAAWLNDNLCVDCYDADIAYGWLDRQEAITERNFRALRDDLTADNLWMHERIADLQSQLEVAQGVNERQDLDYIEQQKRIAELTAEHERIVQEMVDANTRQCERTNELTAERDEWKAECEDLEHANNRQARKIHDVCEANSKLTAERDLYRAALGKAKDAAEEIGRL